MARGLLYGASIVVHGALALGVTLVRPPKKVETIAITMAEAKPKPVEPAKVAPPPPEADAKVAPSRANAKSAPASAKPGAAPKAAANVSTNAAGGDAVPDFGDLSGGTGMALPSAGGGSAGPATNAPKTVERAPVAARKPADDDCAEAAGKPTPIAIPQPAYTPKAREANVEGRVRVEITVDESGRVTGARVLAGLGYGLDEAALAAARGATFKPALRCGKPTRATFVVGMRFSL